MTIFFLFKVQIFAAGFDSSRNIFLGEKATKWQKKNGEFDGLTTNGVLILHPNWCNGEELSVYISVFSKNFFIFLGRYRGNVHLERRLFFN